MEDAGTTIGFASTIGTSSRLPAMMFSQVFRMRWCTGELHKQGGGRCSRSSKMTCIQNQLSRATGCVINNKTTLTIDTIRAPPHGQNRIRFGTAHVAIDCIERETGRVHYEVARDCLRFVRKKTNETNGWSSLMPLRMSRDIDLSALRSRSCI